jgi:hypothetical protein
MILEATMAVKEADKYILGLYVNQEKLSSSSPDQRNARPTANLTATTISTTFPCRTYQQQYFITVFCAEIDYIAASITTQGEIKRCDASAACFLFL